MIISPTTKLTSFSRGPCASSKQTPPSLDFRSVPSERGWALLKIRSPKQFVAHLLNSDDEIGPIEEELDIPAPDSVASKQDLSDLDDTNDVDAYETALEILEQPAAASGEVQR